MKKVFLLLLVFGVSSTPSLLQATPEPQLPEDYVALLDPPLEEPPAQECPVYRATLRYDWDRAYQWNDNPIHHFGEPLSCLEDIIDAAYEACENEYGANWQDDMVLQDECPTEYFNTMMEAGRTSDNYRKTRYLADTDGDGDTEHIYGGTNVHDNIIYFDENCIPADNSVDLTGACDALLIWNYVSPISLILGSVEAFEEEAGLARFPLEPSSKDKWYTWKASKEAPLLVHDPKRTGKITSATQLFGDWTFGGKRLASLAEPKAAQVKWDNGFEALATLDVNRDGRIAGEELAPLALWFDKNRDGVSDPDEVRPIEDEGIKSLGYQVSRVDQRSQNIYVKEGFERIVDGKLVTGTAVDWYGQGAESKTELISKQLAQGTVCN